MSRVQNYRVLFQDESPRASGFSEPGDSLALLCAARRRCARLGQMGSSDLAPPLSSPSARRHVFPTSPRMPASAHEQHAASANTPTMVGPGGKVASRGLRMAEDEYNEMSPTAYITSSGVGSGVATGDFQTWYHHGAQQQVFGKQQQQPPQAASSPQAVHASNFDGSGVMPPLPPNVVAHGLPETQASANAPLSPAWMPPLPPDYTSEHSPSHGTGRGGAGAASAQPSVLMMPPLPPEPGLSAFPTGGGAASLSSSPSDHSLDSHHSLGSAGQMPPLPPNLGVSSAAHASAMLLLPPHTDAITLGASSPQSSTTHTASWMPPLPPLVRCQTRSPHGLLCPGCARNLWPARRARASAPTRGRNGAALCRHRPPHSFPRPPRLSACVFAMSPSFAHVCPSRFIHDRPTCAPRPCHSPMSPSRTCRLIHPHRQTLGTAAGAGASSSRSRTPGHTRTSTASRSLVARGHKRRAACARGQVDTY